jgi:hypothetical protein
MDKRKCAHCGFTFKPKEEHNTLCEACSIQVRDDSGHKRFNATLLGSVEVKGSLLLFPEKIAFEPEEVYFRDKKLEIAVSKIKDVRFATDNDISALRVFLLGAPLGVLLKKKHKMLTIDFDDEFGITQHPVFEGDDMEVALKELFEIRRLGRA